MLSSFGLNSGLFEVSKKKNKYTYIIISNIIQYRYFGENFKK